MARVVHPVELVSDANMAAYTASVRSKYPHMSAADTPVWSAFLSTGAVPISQVLYDVRVGGRGAGSVANSDEFRVMWVTLIRKRIDAVVYSRGQVWTVEVKPLAGMSALGQSITYRDLWNGEQRSKVKARAVVVCARVDDDVEELFSLYGVTVYVVDLSSPLAPRILRVLGSVQ